MKTNARGSVEVQWKLHCAKSCVWTSLRSSGVVRIMDDDTAELIARVCTRVGIIMEDASVSALTIGAKDRTAMPFVLAELELDAARISALVAAAKALNYGS